MDEVKWDWPHTKKWPNFSGPRVDVVKRMFLAGESMNVENFVRFYTDDAHYQFGNFPITHGPDGIRQASGSFADKSSFLGKVEGVHHHLKNIWELDPDTLAVEMEVTYIRHDGKVFTLPCCDLIRFEGDRVKDLRIFMNSMPVFTTP